MRVGFRVDASLAIGTGHLRRCMSLASALRDKGSDVRFVVRRHDTVGEIAFGSQAFSVTWLELPMSTGRAGVAPTAAIPHEHWAGVDWRDDAAETAGALADFQPDWLVVDHYSFDARWHDQVRLELGCKVAAIDDLADRSLSVDILVDANFAEDHAEKYVGRITRKCRLLGGPRFALLSAEYRTAARYHFHPDVRSIGVFMGGTDPSGISADVLRTCREEVGFGGSIEVVSTSANPHLDALRETCAASGDTMLSLDLPNLSAFYARHDLQIGAGGTATYERCCVGAPTIALAVAPNQLAVVPVLAAAGILRAARIPGATDQDNPGAVPILGSVVRDLIAHPEARRTLSKGGMNMVDARGADRVALCILGASLGLRRVTLDDGVQLHAWRNHPAVRAVSGSGEEIPLPGHMDWLAQKLASDDCRLYIAEIGSTAVGSIRFDRLQDGQLEVSLYLDPDLPGLGLGPYLLLAGEREAMAEWPGCATFTAAVMPNNEVSARLFVNCGYSGGPHRYNKPVTQQKSVQ